MESLELIKKSTCPPRHRPWSFFINILNTYFNTEIYTGEVINLTYALSIEEIDVLQFMLLRLGSDLQKAKEGKLDFYELNCDAEHCKKVKRDLLNGH